MGRLKQSISDKLIARTLACVQQLWPDEGVRALGRFVRDAIRRLDRYCNGDLDIPADERLLGVVRKLAVKLYGEDSEASRKRVVETALEMRILWSCSVKENRLETDEAVSKWEFGESPVIEENSGPVRNWLFRR